MLPLCPVVRRSSFFLVALQDRLGDPSFFLRGGGRLVNHQNYFIERYLRRSTDRDIRDFIPFACNEKFPRSLGWRSLWRERRREFSLMDGSMSRSTNDDLCFAQ